MNKYLLLGLLLFVPLSFAHADLKVAVVDLSKAFDGYYKTKDAQARLKEKEEGYQKEIQDQYNDYQRMGQEAEALQKAATDPTLSPAAQQEKAKAFDMKKSDLQAMNQKIQEMKVERTREIQDELFRRHKEIVDEITKVINDYSGPQGYDLVIDKSAASAASGVSLVLYNSSKLVDITADIVKLLNATAPAASATPAPATPATH